MAKKINKQYQQLLEMLTDEKLGNARCAWQVDHGERGVGFRLEGWVVPGRQELIIVQVFETGVEVYSPSGVPGEWHNLAFWLTSKDL